MAENTKAKEHKPSFWQGVKSEWKKILWPSPEELGKQTLLVIAASVVLGLVITLIDSVALQLINFLLAL